MLIFSLSPHNSITSNSTMSLYLPRHHPQPLRSPSTPYLSLCVFASICPPASSIKIRSVALSKHFEARSNLRRMPHEAATWKETREGTTSVKDEGGRHLIVAGLCWERSSEGNAAAPWTTGRWWHGDAFVGNMPLTRNIFFILINLTRNMLIYTKMNYFFFKWVYFDNLKIMFNIYVVWYEIIKK